MASLGESDWRLQPLTAGQAPSVLDLLRVAFSRTEVPLDPPPGALRETVASLEAEILHGGGAGAISGKRVIGSVLWTVSDGPTSAGSACRPNGGDAASGPRCWLPATMKRGAAGCGGYALRRALCWRGTCDCLRGSAIGSLPGYRLTAIHRKPSSSWRSGSDSILSSDSAALTAAARRPSHIPHRRSAHRSTG